MQETLQALRSLQEIDRHIFKVEGELKRLPAELAARQTEMDAMNAQAERHAKAAADLRSSIKEIEHAVTGQRDRKRKLEQESASGKVDAAMLASYTHEIRSVERTVDQAESDALKMMGQVETLEKESLELAERIEAEQATFDEFSSNVEQEIKSAEERLAKLQEDRASVASGAGPIDTPTLELYKGLLATREGEALAELSGRICQGCFVEIPRNLAVRLARGVDLVQCTQCQRILVPGH